MGVRRSTEGPERGRRRPSCGATGPAAQSSHRSHMLRPAMRIPRSITLLASVAAMLLAGCGSSSSGVSASAYVKSICNAVGPFQKDVQARAGALNVATIRDPTSGRTALQSFLGAVADDANQALGKLKSAGTPNVQNGKQISGALVTAFAQVKTALDQAKAQAGSLPTNSPSAFRTAATAIGTTVQNSLTGIGASLGNLKSAELEKAAASEPACKALGQ